MAQQNFKKYIELYNEVEKAQRQIEMKELEISSIKEQFEEKNSELEEQRKNLERRRQKLQKSAADAGSAPFTAFDEQALSEQQEQKRQEQSRQIEGKYAPQFAELEKRLREETGERDSSPDLTLDQETTENYNELCKRKEQNLLPDSLKDHLDNEKPENIIERYKMASAAVLKARCQDVSKLGAIADYAPVWLIRMITLALPLLGALIIYGLLATAAHPLLSSFVYVTVRFLAKLLIIVIACVIGYFIASATVGIGFAGAALLGALSLWLLWSRHIPVSGALVYWVTVVVQLSLAAIACYFLKKYFDKSGLSARLIDRCLQIPAFCGPVLKRQEKELQDNQDKYYILYHHKDLLQRVSDKEQQSKRMAIQGEINDLQKAKDKELKDLEEQGRQRLAEKIREGKRDAAQKNQLWQEELARGKRELEQLQVEFQQVQGEIKQGSINLEKQLQAAEQKIGELAAIQKSAVETMGQILEDSKHQTVTKRESVLSDSIYLIENHDKKSLPRIYPIDHYKKPIVFLYDIPTTNNVANELYPFVVSVIQAFSLANFDLIAEFRNKVFEMTIMDPVTRGRKFLPLKSVFIRVPDEDDNIDIPALTRIITADTRKVAATGKGIDELNRLMLENDEDISKFGKYNIVHFLVPDESSPSNANFLNAELWGSLGDGHENGFLPIFYINYRDFKNTLDDNSRNKSLFVKNLLHSIGKDSNNIFRIDIKNCSIAKEILPY